MREREQDTDRHAAREGLRASKRLETQWIVIPAIIAFVFIVGFGLRLLI